MDFIVLAEFWVLNKLRGMPEYIAEFLNAELTFSSGQLANPSPLSFILDLLHPEIIP
jgi:hypothetical protein